MDQSGTLASRPWVKERAPQHEQLHFLCRSAPARRAWLTLCSDRGPAKTKFLCLRRVTIRVDDGSFRSSFEGKERTSSRPPLHLCKLPEPAKSHERKTAATTRRYCRPVRAIADRASPLYPIGRLRALPRIRLRRDKDSRCEDTASKRRHDDGAR